MSLVCFLKYIMTRYLSKTERVLSFAAGDERGNDIAASKRYLILMATLLTTTTTTTTSDIRGRLRLG